MAKQQRMKWHVIKVIIAVMLIAWIVGGAAWTVYRYHALPLVCWPCR